MKCYKCRFGLGLGRTRYYIANYSNNDEYAWCDRGDPYWTIGGPAWTYRYSNGEGFQEVSPLEILVVLGVDVEEMVRGGKCLESP